MFALALHIHYLERGLISVHEFCWLQSLDYYHDEYQRGGLITISGREVTRRAGRCHLCNDPIPRGSPNFWSRSVGWVHFDKDCAAKILEIYAIIKS